MDVIRPLAAVVFGSLGLLGLAVACGGDGDADASGGALADGGEAGQGNASSGGPGSSADGSADGRPPPIPLEAYCDRLAGEAVALARRCMRIPANEEASYRATIVEQCAVDKLPVASGRETYDGQAAGSCVDRMSKATCNMRGDLCSQAGVFRSASNVAAGMPCEGSTSCAAGLACTRTASCGVGVCQPIVLGGVGATCNGFDAPCDPAIGYCEVGLCRGWNPVGGTCSHPVSGPTGYGRCNPKTSFCNAIGLMGTCVASKGLGEDCGACYNNEREYACCTGGLACDANAAGSPSCKTPKNLGEACDLYYDSCAEGQCVWEGRTAGTASCVRFLGMDLACTGDADCGSHRCDPTRKVCTGAPVGTPCLVSMDLCEPQAICRANPTPDGAATNSGTCAPRGAGGGACTLGTASHPNGCQDGFVCRDSVCVARVPGTGPVGAICLDTSDCDVSAFCPRSYRESNCVARAKVNEPCNTNAAEDALVCGDGLSCAAGLCVKVAQLGEACSGPCRLNTACKPNETGAICAPLSPIGGSCAAGEVCTSLGYCSGGAACVARLAAGTTCSFSDQCASFRCVPATMTCAEAC